MNNSSKRSESLKKSTVTTKDETAEIKYSTSSNAATGSKIARLQETANMYAQKIKSEAETLEKLELDIKRNEAILKKKREEILVSKKKLDGSDPMVLQKKIKSHEVKLEKLKQKLNEGIAYNKNLREEINGLRREKNIFDKVYQQLKNEMDFKKDHLRKIIEESKNAKFEILTAKDELKKAKMNALNEQSEFEKEYKSIFQSYEQDEKREKLKKISEEREKRRMTEQEKKDAVYSSQTNLVMSSTYITQQPVDTDRPSNQTKKKHHNHKDNFDLEKIKNEVEEYEKIFEQLKEETGNQDINEMVKTFVEYEDNNYSLFSYINILNEEKKVPSFSSRKLEELDKQRRALESEIKEYENPDEGKNKDDPKLLKIKQIKDEIDKTIKEREKYEQKHANLTSIIDSLKEGIPIIFERIGCNNEKYTKELGENFDIKDINEGNMLQILSIIERRTMEILDIQNELVLNKPPASREKEEKDNIHNNDFFQTIDKMMEETNAALERALDKNKAKDPNLQLESKEVKKLSDAELQDFAKAECKKILMKPRQKNLKNK